MCFPVNNAKSLRTLFSENNSERLLLSKITMQVNTNNTFNETPHSASQEQKLWMTSNPVFRGDFFHGDRH